MSLMTELLSAAPDGPDRAGPPEAESGAILTVDLGALVANWRLLAKRSGARECAAVVKANAYGIGTRQAVEALAAAGCRTFFVAHIAEAIDAREVAPDATIYVLNGFLPGSRSVFAGLDLRPVLGSLEELAEWRAGGMDLPAALHVDTAMNRLGLTIAEAQALQAGPAPYRPALLMTHLSSAEDRADPVTDLQVERFAAVRRLFPGAPSSIANSSGIVRDTVPGLDVARPGYALYGGNPMPGEANPMRPVVTLQSRVIQVRVVEDGEAVGYNGQWVARGRRRIAIINTGYADGYPRAASATDAKREAGIASGGALVAGRFCPFAGRVSMDLIALDVSEVPENAVTRGTLATLIGGELDIDAVGARAGTIGYEILTSLGRRYARRYVDA